MAEQEPISQPGDHFGNILGNSLSAWINKLDPEIQKNLAVQGTTGIALTMLLFGLAIGFAGLSKPDANDLFISGLLISTAFGIGSIPGITVRNELRRNKLQ